MFLVSKRLFFSTLIRSVFQGLFPTIELILSRNLISKLTVSEWEGSIFYISMIILFALFYYVIMKVLDIIEGNSYTLIKQNMWFELFEKTSSLDLALADLPSNRTLYEEARGATSNNRCTKVLNSFFSILTHIIALISTLAIMVVVNPLIMLVIFVMVLVQTILTIQSQKQQYQTWKEDAKTNKEISYVMGLLFDRNCANELRLHNLSQWVINKYKAVRKKSDEYWIRNHKKQSKFGAFMFLANLLQKAILYIYLAVQVVFKNMSIANFTLCFKSLNRMSSELTSLIKVIVDIGEDSKYIKSFKEYMELKNIIAIHSVDDKNISRSEILHNPIVLNNVSFRYPGTEKDVLKDINIKIEPMKFYVIVGANGAGKTTFINLLMRLYDPTKGTISLGTTDIKRYDYQNYRDCFGVVFQNYKVFDYSILENITLNEIIDESMIDNAKKSLDKAGLTTKIESLKNGIYTYIGRSFNDEGIQLSGGEYQKVALAKALYRNSPILVLDEPSSALDAFAEDDLITTFKKASKDKTVFYISHRLSVARYAHKVLFIDNNGIAGFDTHENLLCNCPMYKEMYVAQAKHYTENLK